MHTRQELALAICNSCKHQANYRCTHIGIKVTDFILRRNGICPIGKHTKGEAKHWGMGMFKLLFSPILILWRWQLVKRRARICNSCEKYKYGRCTACGCAAAAKAAYKGEKCPLGKW